MKMIALKMSLAIGVTGLTIFATGGRPQGAFEKHYYCVVRRGSRVLHTRQTIP
jgi:hypothetical protein